MRNFWRHSLKLSILLMLAVMSFGAAGVQADVIIDNGGGGTSSTGTWAASGGTTPYGANSLWARDGATYTWTMTSQPAGTYEVYMWWSGWSSRATNVPVTIVHRDGSNTINVNQLQNAGKWNSLGQFYFNGTGTVSIRAAYGSTLSTCADAVRFVNVGGGVNQPPTAVNDSATTAMNTPVTVNVVSNDTDDGGIDASSVAIVTSPTSGTAASNGNGTVTYTPNAGFTGSDSFTYTVADAQSAVSNQATVTVTVNAASTEVVIDNGKPGTSFTGSWAPSGASGYYGSNSVWSRDGTAYNWTFTPAVSGNYDVSMWWTVWSSRSAGVPVDIEHSGGTEYLFINQQQNGGKWNSLGVYSLIAGQSYTVTIISQPGPSSTCADAVKFSYLGGGGGVNQPPTAANDSATTAMNTSVTINVVSNDTDDGGIDASSVAIVTSPTSGTAASNGNGTVTYTPNAGFTGSDSFTYTVADAQSAVSNQATVTVTVNAASTEVVIDNGKPGTSFTGSWAPSGASGYYGSNSVWSRDGTAYNWTFTPAVSGNYDVSMWWTVWSSRSAGVPVDIEHSGGTEYLFINQQQNGGKWNSLGVYSLIAGQSYTVTIISQPGPSSTCADAVKFSYLGGGGGVNQPPTAANDSATTAMNTSVTINVVSNDTDDGGIDASSVAIVTSPTSGTAASNGNGTVTYTPNAGFTGSDSFTYTVADAQSAVSNQATVTVTVNAASTEVVIDNGKPGTSFTGSWAPSGASGYYGSNSVWSRDGTAYNWTFTPAVSGNYDVSMWWTVWSSRSAGVPVDIEHSGGTEYLFINQQQNGGKWNSLGVYSLIAGQSYTVTIISQPGPSSTCADAVKFSYLGGGGGVNQPPTAANDSATTAMNTSVTINVVSNDTDDGGIDASSVAIVTSPTSGTAASNGNGTVTYTPNAGFTGSDSFTYTVADAQSAVSNQATVTVTVNAASTEVVIDNGKPGTSFTGSWAPSGASGYYGSNSVWSRDGTAYNWTFTPAVSGNYDVSMWWTVWSSRSAGVPVDIEHSGGTEYLFINQQQNGGKWNSLGVYSLIAGQSYTVTIISQPGPSSTCADAVKFSYLGGGGGVNQPPTAANDSATTAMNTSVTINVVSNDTDDGGIDASSVAIVTSPTSGTAASNGNGTVTYTPNAGFTGSDSFTYTVADAQSAVSNQATVTVTVNAASTEVVIDNGKPGTSFTGSWAPSGASGYYGSNSVWSRDGTAYNWTFTPAVSGNYDVSMWWTVWSSRSAGVPVDIEHSGGTEYLFINQQQNGGKWNSLGVYSLIAGQSYTVTIISQPGPSSTCADAVKFSYLGGGGGVNQPPTAANDSATTAMNTSVTINVVSNDTDDGGIDASSVAIVTFPVNGTVVSNGNGTVTYTPGEAFTGADSFQYTVADAQSAVSNQATVTVTVNAQNISPTAASDTASTTMNTPVTINVVINDTDDGGINASSVAIATSPVSGTAASNGNGTVTYTPDAGFTGADAFTYTVADAQGSVSNQATVTVTVNAASVEVVLDTSGSGTSYTGSWAASGASGYYGSNSLWSRDGATYTWSFIPAVSGTYDVSMWWTVWSSRSTTIPVDIRHAGGTTRVVINQQVNGGKWNSLGLYSFASGVRYTVTITSQPGPTSTCADAVKFTNVGSVGNIPPTAVIDSITPNPALPGGNVNFSGRGVEVDGGEIFAYSWRSNIDGVISTSSSFSTSDLSSGQHTIFFKVQDDEGAWSTEASMHLDVTNQALNTENIYLILLYGADNRKTSYVTLLQSLGGYLEGDTWKYTNQTTGKSFHSFYFGDGSRQTGFL
jgi:anthranilate/para-aminobenzoate synthase component II